MKQSQIILFTLRKNIELHQIEGLRVDVLSKVLYCVIIWQLLDCLSACLSVRLVLPLLYSESWWDGDFCPMQIVVRIEKLRVQHFKFRLNFRVQLFIRCTPDTKKNCVSGLHIISFINKLHLIYSVCQVQDSKYSIIILHLIPNFSCVRCNAI